MVGNLEDTMPEEVDGAGYCGGGWYVGLFEDVRVGGYGR